jgi:predicted porin
LVSVIELAAAGVPATKPTTLGRIGTGFMYADWKSQIAYSSPNWNGFSFTVGLTQGWNALAFAGGAGSTERSGSETAYEGKASYEWTGDVAGKIWASAISQKVEGLTNATAADLGVAGFVAGTPAVANSITDTNDRATAWDLGATVNVAGFGLTGYYGEGKGIGQTVQLLGGFDANGKRRDSDQWYLQGTYTIPGVGTKLGVSYGESTLDGNSADTFNEIEDSMWTVGAYHPLTKHLNLVAEYSEAERDQSSSIAANDGQVKAKTISLGAILFF